MLKHDETEKMRKPWSKNCIWPKPGDYGYYFEEDLIPDELDEEAEELSELHPVWEIEDVLGYRFINENLLRQAFTRRSFASEYALDGDCEALEFYGDSILNAVVTREIFNQFSAVERSCLEAPFSSTYDEGDLTKIRIRYVCKEHLAKRCEVLGLDQYILYGAGDVPSENSKEDLVEALIGAVAVDCQWDMSVLTEVIDRLISIQLDCVDSYLKKDFYEVLNTWHQKHFGEIPEYDLYKGKNGAYCCSLRFKVPDFEKGTYTYERTESMEATRSMARAEAAKRSYDLLARGGHWMNLRDSGIEPDMYNSINQLQELYQKKYIQDMPVYTFEERTGDEWYVICQADTFIGWGIAGNKTKAKKKAAFMMLRHMYQSAGIKIDKV